MISEKKKAILESALELITENGFHGCPMSQVATNANVAAGTIYHYFESKSQLIKEVNAFVKRERMNAILSKDDYRKDFKVRFYGFWSNLFNYYVKNPKSIIFLEQYSSSPYFKKDNHSEKEKFFEIAGRFFKAGVEKGLLRKMDIKLMVALVHSSIIITAKMQVIGTLQMTQERIDQALQASWDSIKSAD